MENMSGIGTQLEGQVDQEHPITGSDSIKLDNLKLPVLLVRGGLSDVLSEEGAQSFLDQCPHAEYVNVSNAAHMVAGDRNDIFAESVIEFLLRVAPLEK